eukprot:CAMPEP_0114534850 /NCGR_PEP_ID=MMETSP0109-20121206/28071_1 /TAXON_ID=29199 /ORGANISM="Chlorarachnion reptans, Strain CCCM449" /LENGTH=534 /DNA_ID=CAMNT_0001718313 /DNA_START=104 /DNA_END=1708 /DNA_ORIENTATION=-
MEENKNEPAVAPEVKQAKAEEQTEAQKLVEVQKPPEEPKPLEGAAPEAAPDALPSEAPTGETPAVEENGVATEPAPVPVKKPKGLSQHAEECLRRLKGHRAPRGKRKVEFISDAAKRASTFSTLRQTIMRKLGELEVKCDAKILIAFHSHKKHVKTYAYGLNNWSSNKSNFDKVCQQTFYDRPCAPDGQDPLAEKARDELRSIYRSLMQRFCQGKNPGYGKPQKCPKWMPQELWIMVDKMKPDQLREAIRKVEDVIKEEHNSKVPRSAPPPPPVGMRQFGMPPPLQNQGLMQPPRQDMGMVPPAMGMPYGQRPPHMGGKMDSFMPHPQSYMPAGLMQHQMKANNFQMRPPMNQMNQMQGGMNPGQMTPGLQNFQGGKKDDGQQPRIDLNDSADMKNFNQGMMQNKILPSPSIQLLSPNFAQSPNTPGFNKDPQREFKEDFNQYSGFAHQPQMQHMAQMMDNNRMQMQRQNNFGRMNNPGSGAQLQMTQHGAVPQTVNQHQGMRMMGNMAGLMQQIPTHMDHQMMQGPPQKKQKL